VDGLCAEERISPNVKKKAGAKFSHLPGKPGTRKQLLPLLPFGPDGVGSVSATRLPFHFSKMAERRGNSYSPQLTSWNTVQILLLASPIVQSICSALLSTFPDSVNQKNNPQLTPPNRNSHPHLPQRTLPAHQLEHEGCPKEHLTIHPLTSPSWIWGSFETTHCKIG